MVIRQGMLLAAIGVVVGVGAAYGLSRFMENFVFGVEATDLLTFVGVPVLLVLIALVATWVPALRASRVEPLEALRYE